MWAVVNTSPFKAMGTWGRDKDGRHRWIVAVKATYELVDRTWTIADEQDEVVTAPEYLGDDGTSSLRCDSDLLAPKPGTDVTVIGSAHAPRGRAVAELPVSLRVGPIEKVLTVRGVNIYYDGALGRATTAPRPFERMPIVYERAFGGADTRDPDPTKHRIDLRNPIGVGFGTDRRNAGEQPGPNVVYPGKDPALAGPAGFGPIPSFWLPRSKYAGTYDAAWIRDRKPLLPEDFDLRHHRCAPADQQTDHLGPNTRIQVVHMTPEGVLDFTIPDVQLKMTSFFGRRGEPHEVRISGVCLEPDRGRATVVWHASMVVPPTKVEFLDGTRVECR